MNDNTTIKTTKVIFPQIYAYVLPTMPQKSGWIKIGYTEREDVHERIKEQTHTAAINLPYTCLWSASARYKNSDFWFKDTHFHSYLTRFKQVEREPKTEWFKYVDNPEDSWLHFEDFITHQYDQTNEKEEYTLRQEQQDAVSQTLTYFKENEDCKGVDDINFLWNAKPRFGKTLTSYDLARQLGARNVLVLTNRPAVANSWFDDYQRFIAWQTTFKFVSTADSLKDRLSLTRSEFEGVLSDDPMASQIAFISLQDLKGAVTFGGDYHKLEWVQELKWDLVIIDESHEGVNTDKAEVALERIQRDYTLYLSGTPFKQLARGIFEEGAIYNWTYADEQSAKENWSIGEQNDAAPYRWVRNPYASLPRLSLFSYQMSQMLTDEVNQGAQVNGETIDYAFDLNEFFKTKDNGKFVYEAQVVKWLDTLSTNEKYPFSTAVLRNELKHTFWLLERVASAKALHAILKKHDVFKEYTVVLAAGDGKSHKDKYISDETEKENITSGESNKRSFDKVRSAIEQNERTITLSVGQLTTGITIPEWTAVFMLSNITSPAKYMQAAFRAQNAWDFVDSTGGRHRKEQAYVFDFAPERTLIIYDKFANNLSTQTTQGGGTTQERKNNIRRLLNFFPVISMDSEGQMVELEVDQVLTIPKTIKAQEVVKRGFMSNLLFQNISGIFAASPEAREILEQLNPVPPGKIRPETIEKKIDTQGVSIDENGEVEVDNNIVIAETEANFGAKVYEITQAVEDEVLPLVDEDSLTDKSDSIAKKVAGIFTAATEKSVTSMAKDNGLSTTQAKSIVKANEQAIQKEIAKVHQHAEIEAKLEAKKYQEEIAKAKDNKDQQAQQKLETELAHKQQQRQQDLQQRISETVETKTKELVQNTTHTIVKKVEEKKQSDVEDDIRARLRGFARTIPSFLMAYGTTNTELSNFDTTIANEVFHEVTGITLDQFRILRDKHDFFDEVVFNESVQEFLRKKLELGNYFDDSQKEDIFDYIPPQKTNQIFTPKTVVKMQMDFFANENPGIFSDPNQTFVDFYMKSGLYITEVITRLYKGLSEIIPERKERLKHILEKQVYGFAPSEIIYSIAKNFIMGFLELEEFSNLQDIKTNFVSLDITPFATADNSSLFREKCAEVFGNTEWENKAMKFNNVVGNPPYQLETAKKKSKTNNETVTINIFHHFQMFSDKYSSGRTSLIYPGERWILQNGKGKGLKEFAKNQINDVALVSIHFFPTSKEVFELVDVPGGVSIVHKNKAKTTPGFKYTLHTNGQEKTYHLDNPGDITITLNPEDYIIGKKSIDFMRKNNFGSVYDRKLAQKAFGIESSFVEDNPTLVRKYTEESTLADNEVKIFTNDVAGKSGRATWYIVDKNHIPKKQELIHQWKVVVSTANAGGAKRDNQLQVLDNQSVFGRVRLGLACFDTKVEALNFEKFCKTYLVRFLFYITGDALGTLGSKVPDLQDYSANQNLLDFTRDLNEQLYELIGLEDHEIRHVEKKMKAVDAERSK